MGMPDMKPREFPATMPDMFPARRGGLLITVPVEGFKNDDCVPTEEVEFDLVGEEGRACGPAGAGGGEGAVTDRLDKVRWWPGAGKEDGGAVTDVGVGSGVF